MSFKDGNLHEKVEQLELENMMLRELVRFTVDRLLAFGEERHADYPSTHPATWQYIVRQSKEANL